MWRRHGRRSCSHQAGRARKCSHTGVPTTSGKLARKHAAKHDDAHPREPCCGEEEASKEKLHVEKRSGVLRERTGHNRLNERAVRLQFAFTADDQGAEEQEQKRVILKTPPTHQRTARHQTKDYTSLSPYLAWTCLTSDSASRSALWVPLEHYGVERTLGPTLFRVPTEHESARIGTVKTRDRQF